MVGIWDHHRAHIGTRLAQNLGVTLSFLQWGKLISTAEMIRSGLLVG